MPSRQQLLLRFLRRLLCSCLLCRLFLCGGLCFFRSEASSHCVFSDVNRNQKLHQIIRTARLTANAAHSETAERLSLHDGSGDLTVQVQVAHVKIIADTFQCSRAATVDAASQCVACVIGDAQCFVKIFCLHHDQHRPKDFVLSKRGIRIDAGNDVRTDEVAFFGKIADIDSKDHCFTGFRVDVFCCSLDPFDRFFVDHRTHVCGRIVCRSDNQTLCRFSKAFNKLIVSRRQHDDSRASRTLLSGITKRTVHNAEDGFIQVCVVVNDNRVFATHFCDDFANVRLSLVGVRCDTVDFQADFV